jgi:hypothetical protein
MESRKSPLGTSLVVIVVTKSSIHVSCQMCFIDLGLVSWCSEESQHPPCLLMQELVHDYLRIKTILELKIDLETMKRVHCRWLCMWKKVGCVFDLIFFGGATTYDKDLQN